MAAGDYSRFRRLGNNGAENFDARFPPITAAQTGATKNADGTTRYAFDANADGKSDVTMNDPSFNARQFRSNTVFRWEYRPGSVMYVVWGQQRDAFTAADGRFAAGRNMRELFEAPAGNVLAVKWSYWMAK